MKISDIWNTDINFSIGDLYNDEPMCGGEIFFAISGAIGLILYIISTL